MGQWWESKCGTYGTSEGAQSPAASGFRMCRRNAVLLNAAGEGCRLRYDANFTANEQRRRRQSARLVPCFLVCVCGCHTLCVLMVLACVTLCRVKMFTTLWMWRQEYQHHEQLPLAFNGTWPSWNSDLDNRPW